MRFRLLGTFDGDGDERAERLLAQPKRAAVLAYLLAERHKGPVPRDALLAMFWPELDTPRARNALNQALHFLRSVLGRDAIVTHGTTRLSVAEAVITTDLDTFRSALAGGAHADALGCYRGDFVAGLHLSGAPEFERWLDATRGDLRTAALTAVGTLARGAANAGDTEAELRWMRRTVDIDPFEEAPVRALATALERVGRPAEAIRVLDVYAERLREMGIAPQDRDTSRLARRIREAAVRAPADIAPPAAEDTPPPPPPALPAVSPRRRWWPRAAAALALLALGTVALSLSRPDDEPAMGGAIAVQPFAVLGDSADRYLGDAVATLLTTHLDELGVAPVLSEQAAGARARAARVVQGRVTVRGDAILLEARLRDVSRDTVLATASATTSVRELFAAVDGLAAELAGSLVSTAMTGGASRVVRAASRTTSSLPALRAYLEGERMRAQGRYTAATEAFLQSTKLDPDFALAHYRLALVSDWSGEGEWSRGATDAALARADRLTPRYKGLVSAVRHYMARDLVQGERELLRLIRDYPDESEAWFLLGELRFHYGPLSGRPLTDAKAAFEEVLRLEPAHAEAMLHLARLAALERDAAGFERYLAQLRRPARADERQLEVAAIHTFAFGSANERRAFLDSLDRYSEVEVDVASKAVAVYTGDLDGAAAIAARLVAGRATGWRARGLAWQAQLSGAAGRWDVAAAQLDSVADIAPAFAAQAHAALAAVPTAPDAFARAARTRVLGTLDVRRPVPGEIDVVRLEPARQLYLAALVDARLADSSAAAARLAALDRVTAVAPAARQEYRRSLEAVVAYTRRDWETVASRLAPTEQDAYGVIGDGLQMGRAAERWMRLQALQCLGRNDEAATWKASFPEPAGYDIAYREALRTVSSARCSG